MPTSSAKRPRQSSTRSRYPFAKRKSAISAASSCRRCGGETGDPFALSPPARASLGCSPLAGVEPPPALPKGQGLVFCVLPPAGGQGEASGSGSCAARTNEGSGGRLQCSVELRLLPAFLRVPRGVGSVGRCSLVVARPPDLPLSAVTADGATRAARMGAALSEASGDPVWAGGSCRQRNVPGRSVGTSAAPEPLPPLE